MQEHEHDHRHDLLHRLGEKLDRLIALSDAERNYQAILEKLDELLALHASPPGGHEDILSLLRAIHAQGEQIVATLQETLDKITDIDAKTTQQAASLTSIAANLQGVNDDIDELIRLHGNNVPAPVLAALNSLATRTQTNSDAVAANATFSGVVGNKWPLPTPPPPPPPPPPP